MIRWGAFSGRLGDEGGWQPAMSANGRFVAFTSASGNLVAGDRNRSTDVFVRDGTNGRTEIVSSGSTPGSSGAPSISADGRFVAFPSHADLAPGGRTCRVGGATKTCPSVYVRDRSKKTFERISVSSAERAANAPSESASISADGRYVAFSSAATNLISGDTNEVADIFLRDRVAGTTIRVSVGTDGAQAGAASRDPVISGDGSAVAFVTAAEGLTEVRSACGDGCERVAVRLLRDGRTAEGWEEGEDYEQSERPSLSGDGRVVAFLGTEDPSTGVQGVYKRNLRLPGIRRVSARGSTAYGARPSLSWDGLYVAFLSRDEPGHPGSTCERPASVGTTSGPCPEVFLSYGTKPTELLSVNTRGDAQDGGGALEVSLSGSAAYAAFTSSATWVEGPSCGEWRNCPDVFVRDRAAKVTRLVSRASHGTR